jgi:multimeric flavodoxin WrbA
MQNSDPAARTFLFLIASSRNDGATETLARHAADGLAKDHAQRWIRLAALPLDPFVDIRHESDGTYPEPQGHARSLLDATLEATDLVFVVPVYWYSLPTWAKLYLDHWSGWMRVPGVDFKSRMAGKRIWTVTIVSDRRSASAEPLLGCLRLTADYMGMEWGGALIGNANKPADILEDADALRQAKRLFVSDAMPDARSASTPPKAIVLQPR